MLGGVLLLGLGFAAAAALGLRRQYKLAEARRTFVAAVSHELRTPLAHVNALSETLLLGRAESPEQAQRWLRAIHREGRRLSVLTENVLLHARGERRGIRAAPQWTDIGAVVHDAVSLVEAQAQARSARIVVAGTAVDGGGAGGWIDATAVRQIVINFIENALKFGPDGQTVTVTLDVERLAATGGAGGRAASERRRRRARGPARRSRPDLAAVRAARGGRKRAGRHGSGPQRRAAAGRGARRTLVGVQRAGARRPIPRRAAARRAATRCRGARGGACDVAARTATQVRLDEALSARG